MLLRVRWALEHVEHALGDGEAAANVDGGDQHGQGGQALARGVGQHATAQQHQTTDSGQACVCGKYGA